MAATEATILAHSTARAHAGVGPGATGPLRRQRACAAQHARFPSTTPRRTFLQGASPGNSSLVTGDQARPRIVHEAPACGCRSTSACAGRSAHPHEYSLMAWQVLELNTGACRCVVSSQPNTAHACTMLCPDRCHDHPPCVAFLLPALACLQVAGALALAPPGHQSRAHGGDHEVGTSHTLGRCASGIVWLAR